MSGKGEYYKNKYGGGRSRNFGKGKGGDSSSKPHGDESDEVSRIGGGEWSGAGKGGKGKGKK